MPLQGSLRVHFHLGALVQFPVDFLCSFTSIVRRMSRNLGYHCHIVPLGHHNHEKPLSSICEWRQSLATVAAHSDR